MIIVKIMGGLASQIHKFILGMTFAKELNTELILDLSDYYEGYFRPYRLDALCIPKLRTVRTRNIKDAVDNLVYLNTKEDILNMLNNPNSNKNYYFYKEETDFGEFFLEYPKYEMSTKSAGIEYIKPKTEGSFVKEFSESIKGSPSVSVHVRRGDFVTLGWESDDNYYLKAIDYMEKAFPGAKFYFFSNDMDWTRATFGEKENYEYVSSKDELNADIDEFFAMSLTDGRILSPHSGYGLLANVIGGIGKPSGFAVAPKYEDGDYEYQDIEGRIRYI